MPPPPPPPPELMDELVGEILLRLPPDEPKHLLRASLVSKHWLRIVSDPAFLRSYRAYHGAPPLLGLLHCVEIAGGKGRRGNYLSPRLAATTPLPAFIPPAASDGRNSRALDSRHGRVLVHIFDMSDEFLVWDPVTGAHHRLPELDVHLGLFSIAVLCATAGCDHLDCHGGPFRVVFVTCESLDSVCARVYSSETGAWSSPTSDFIGDNDGYGNWPQHSRVALIEDELYISLNQGQRIISYDWRKSSLSEISPPPPPQMHGGCFALMVMEDYNSLGIASIEDRSLYIWSRKVNAAGAAEWLRCKVIELGTIIPKNGPCDKGLVAGFAEGVDVIFVSIPAGLFSLDLKSKQLRKVYKAAGASSSVLPYMSFYTPAHARLSALVSTH